LKRWQSLALGLIVSVVSLAYALHGVPLDTLWGEFAHARYIYLLPGLALVIVALSLRALRWRALLGGRITLTHSFHILNIGYFFGSLLPFRLGDVARVYLAAQIDPPVSAFTTLSTLVVERLTDIVAVVMMVVAAVSLSPVSPSVITAAQASGAVAIIGLVTLSVLANRRGLAHRLLHLTVGHIKALARLNPEHMLDRLLDGIAPIGSVRGLGTVLGWSGLIWLVSIAEGFVLMAMLYDKPSLDGTLLMIAMGALAVALPAVPGNIGPFEAAVISGLALAGMTTPDSPELRARALAYAVIVHVVNSGMYAFCGWIGLTHEKVGPGQLIRAAQALARRTPAETQSTGSVVPIEPIQPVQSVELIDHSTPVEAADGLLVSR
jgi:hypothetical protein